MNKMAISLIIVVLLVVYGVLAMDYMKQGPEQERLLSEIEEPHKKLHESAVEVEKIYDPEDTSTACQTFESHTIPQLQKVEDILSQIVTISDSAAENKSQEMNQIANQVFRSIIIVSIA